MRRLRESGIVTILLLGLTGCTGLQQRMGWTEPPYVGDEDSAERPLSRLAFWRRPRSDASSPAASASDLAEPGRTRMIAGTGPAADDDQERPGLLRRLPIVGRLWKDDDRDDSSGLDMPAARYAPGVIHSRALAYGPQRNPAGGGPSSASRPAPASQPASSSSSPVAAARPAATTPDSDPAPAPTTASAETDQADDPPVRELTLDLAGRPQVDSSAVPARNPGSQAAPGPAPSAPGATGAGPQAQPRNLPDVPVPSLGREDVPPPSATPGPQPNLITPDLSPAQTSRSPATPSPAVTSPSPAATSQPESAANPPAASGTGTTTVISSPGPVWPEVSPITFSGSSQSLIMPSSQGGYISGGCEEPCGPRCKTHKLCPFKKHKQSTVVLPSAQGMVSSCEATAPCKVKKPCFLKTWLHHKSGCKSKGCKGCKSCSYCGEPAPMVSAQEPMVSPQWQ